jgi:LPPG:FO 2-phospho-L-lactate transferase
MGGPVRVVVLAGGFGGARMAHGFALLGEAVELTVITNTADDLEVHGLHVSPDLDTVMYTLAGIANTDTGWGVRAETWSAAEMLARYGAPTWFRLGDRDLATHMMRTQRLRAGARLTDVTRQLARGLGVHAQLIPMTDDPVRTKISTDAGWLDFQDYFVRRGQADQVRQVAFDGVEHARPTAEAIAAIEDADLIAVAPSNPFVSIAPILAVPGMIDALRAAAARTIAVSPIVGGAALRGPAAAMLASLEQREPGAAAIAAHYADRYPGLVDILVIDEADRAQAGAVSAAGIEPLVSDTLIGGESDRKRLAGVILTAARPSPSPAG